MAATRAAADNGGSLTHFATRELPGPAVCLLIVGGKKGIPGDFWIKTVV